MLRKCVLFLGLICALPPTMTKADVLYDSITQSIASAEAQAYIWLSKGKYVSENGRSRVIWDIPKDTRTTLRFRYALGTIQDGLIDFGSQGTSFLIKSESLCSKITVRKIAVLPGGAIDESESDYTLDPPSQACQEPRSQLEQALEDVVSLQIDPAKTFSVTARLLPRRFCFDASDEQLVVNKAVEEVVPFLGCAAGIFEHLLQFVHAVVRQCGHGFVVSGVHGDDAAVAQIIIVGDDCLKKFRVLFENFGNKFDRTDVGDCRHQAAFASIAVIVDQFHGRSSSSRLIL